MKDKTLTREQIVWLRAKLVDLEDDGTEALCDMAEAYRRILAQPAAGTVVVPVDPDERIPHLGYFDEELYVLCRHDDYHGLYRALINRMITAPQEPQP